MSGLAIDPADTRFRTAVQGMNPVHGERIALINTMADVDQAGFLEPAWFAAHLVTMDSALAAHPNANQGS